MPPAKKKTASTTIRQSNTSPKKIAPSKKTASRAMTVLERLYARYPVRHTHLNFASPWELLIATILSAQCTDVRVNQVTPVLFGRWPGPAELAAAPRAEVEEVVRATGFFRNKARNIIDTAALVVSRFNGQVPAAMEALVSLPGVARKTANVVLWSAFGINEGLAVDTHVSRIAMRLGLTPDRDPVRAEAVLTSLFPREHWGEVNHMLVWFGRQVCTARSPRCNECEMLDICERFQVDHA